MGLYGDWILPWLTEHLTGGRDLERLRRELLGGLKGRGLEVGFGTGTSLRLYPPTVTELIVLDPARDTLARTQRRIAAAPVPVTRLPYRGSGPYDLPDGSLDFVVTMLTLCTIPAVEDALREIRRVLRPGGRFGFLEHGASPEPAIAKWQGRLNGLQQRLAGGCHLNRRIDVLVRDAGFSQVEVERLPFPGAPRFFGPAYRGLAQP